MEPEVSPTASRVHPLKNREDAQCVQRPHSADPVRHCKSDSFPQLTLQKEHQQPLRELNKVAIINDFTILVAWSWVPLLIDALTYEGTRKQPST